MPCPFRTAVDLRDPALVFDSLAPNVRFFSPIVFKPFLGAQLVSGLIEELMAIFEDFRYTDELTDGSVTALIFETQIGSKQVQGLDLLRHNPEGQIETFSVMMRPQTGVDALRTILAPRIARLKATL